MELPPQAELSDRVRGFLAEGRLYPVLGTSGRASLAFMDVTDPFNWVGAQAVVEEVIDDVATARDQIVELAVRYDEADEESVARFRSQQRVSFRLRIIAVHDHLED